VNLGQARAVLPREIIFYETDFGDKPVEDFLAMLDFASRAKAVRALELLRNQQFLSSKFWKKLHGSENLWEVRVEYSGNIYRILACMGKNNRVILLHAFQKKTQKTPVKEMQIAEQRKKRYFQKSGYL
jgi:phage-related protein